MTLVFLIASMALVPYFASRAFLPLFATACVARFGGDAPQIVDLAGLDVVDQIPAAMTSDAALAVLLVLALLEVVGTKFQTVRELLLIGDPPFKAVAATVLVGAMAYGAVDQAQIARLSMPQLTMPTGVALTAAGGPVAYAWALFVGALVWMTATLRSAIWGFLIEIDEHDDLRLQGLLSWLEDVLGIVGVVFVVILPTVALILTGTTILGLWIVKRILMAREARQKVDCAGCRTPFPTCGLHCPSCGTARRDAQQVGWLGTIRKGLAADRGRHRLDLLTRKRCGFCGERLAGRRVDGACSACRHPAFRDLDDLERYLAMVRGRLPKILGILFVLGFVPVLGLVVGVVVYRVSIIASLRSHVPRSTGIVARWMARIARLVLIVLQPIPLVGAFSLPLLCLVSYSIYSRLLRRHARAVLAPARSPTAVVATA